MLAFSLSQKHCLRRLQPALRIENTLRCFQAVLLRDLWRDERIIAVLDDPVVELSNSTFGGGKPFKYAGARRAHARSRVGSTLLQAARCRNAGLAVNPGKSSGVSLVDAEPSQPTRSDPYPQAE